MATAKRFRVKNGLDNGSNTITGVGSNNSTIDLAGNLTTSGANALTLTTSGTTSVTLPTSGTLAKTSGETLTNLTLSGTLTAGGGTGTNGQVLQSTGTGVQWANDSGITGSGTSGQVTYWNGSGTVTGESDLTYDATNNAMTIGAAKVGSISGYAGFASPSNFDINSYAVLQTSSETIINAKTGQFIKFRVNNSDTYGMTFDGTYWTISYNSSNKMSMNCSSTGVFSFAAYSGTSAQKFTFNADIEGGGVVLSRKSAAYDGVQLSGRAGGTGTYTGSITTTTLGADRTYTLPDTTGTIALTANKLSDFAATSSSELAGIISDETGSGALVFGTSPTFTTSILTGSTTVAVFNTTATTVNAFGAATTISIGAGTGTTTVNNNLTVTGDLVVNGTTTTVNSTTISVDDKNIELGSVTSPSNTTADGGGITLKGTTDKTFNWVNATAAWTSSEHIDLASGKAFYINGTSVLSGSTLGSGVTASSLTSVGTITTGTWNATTIATNKGGTGLTSFTSGGAVYATSTSALTTGTLPVASGGTGLTSGTSGGVLYYSASGTLASSGALTANALVIGGGAGSAPSTTTTGTGVLTFLGTPSSANLAAAVTDETGSGALVFGTAPTITTSLGLSTSTPTAIGLLKVATLTTSATTANQVVDSNSSTTYRCVEYFIQIVSGTSYHITKLLVVHDGTTAYVTEYGSVSTADIATFDADISGGNIRLLTTPTNAVTTYKVIGTLITA